ncbi:reverse transcriptase [Gossypium australe]|uniref:Reverse transcriptase n=1 Tax=Gossypium australe TaxID=47621 RepID=A0A5B6VM47_9ROSI|nr:reverse transcriptase [Gossypium australe]
MANQVYVYIDHSTLKYVMKKKDTKSRLMNWVLLLQEFDLWVLNRKGTKNQVADHLLQLEIEDEQGETGAINKSFTDEQLFLTQCYHVKDKTESMPWYANIKKKWGIFLAANILLLVRDTSREKQSLEKFFNLVSIGPLLFMMHMSLRNDVIDAKERVTFPNAMKCFRKES